jgi:hypothetical protein
MDGIAIHFPLGTEDGRGSPRDMAQMRGSRQGRGHRWWSSPCKEGTHRRWGDLAREGGVTCNGAEPGKESAGVVGAA